MIKKIILTIGLAMGLTSSYAGVTTNSLFSANEASLSLASGYSFGGRNSFNLSAGAQYMVLNWLGADVSLPLYQEHGVSVDSISLGGVGRLVLTDRLALVGRAGAFYNWVDEKFSGYFATGPEYRLGKAVGIFANAQYRYPNFDNFTHGEWSAVAGLRFVLK